MRESSRIGGRGSFLFFQIFFLRSSCSFADGPPNLEVVTDPSGDVRRPFVDERSEKYGPDHDYPENFHQDSPYNLDAIRAVSLLESDTVELAANGAGSRQEILGFQQSVQKLLENGVGGNPYSEGGGSSEREGGSSEEGTSALSALELGSNYFFTLIVAVRSTP